MKKFLIFGTIVLLVLMMTSSCIIFFDEEEDGTLVIHNDDDVWDIVEVYISDANASSWGSERLQGDFILTGETRSFDLEPGDYDIWIVDDFADSFYLYDETITEGDRTHVYYTGNDFY